MDNRFGTPSWVRSMICIAGCIAVLLLLIVAAFVTVDPKLATGVLLFGIVTARLGFKTIPQE